MEITLICWDYKTALVLWKLPSYAGIIKQPWYYGSYPHARIIKQPWYNGSYPHMLFQCLFCPES